MRQILTKCQKMTNMQMMVNRVRYGMAGLSMAFLRPNPVRNTEIVSLSIQGT
jgi:hypothetical protein